LVEPVDAIPINGPFPPGIEELADDFIKNNYDVQRLIRVIVASKPFQLDSRWANSTEQVDLLENGEHVSVDTQIAQLCEQSWAAFPMTQLRPEQMAACIHQACRLKTIDASSSILSQLELFGSVNDFTNAYGDRGEDEFIEQSVTIPQRLLMMNGNFLAERIDHNPIMNASTRIASLARDDATAIDNAFLATLNEGDEVIIPEPFYANYLSFACSAGAKVVPVKTSIDDGFSLPPIEDFERLITSKTKAIIISNPGNPTGMIYSKEDLEKLRDIILKSCYKAKENFIYIRG
jgi:hypothetical protein